MSTQENKSNVIVASKHVPVLAWLAKHASELSSIAQYIPTVRRHHINENTILIGSWPVHLINKAKMYLTIEFQRSPSTSDLSLEDMESHGAYLKRYQLLDDNQLCRLVELSIEEGKRQALEPTTLPLPLNDFIPALLEEVR